jgi:hypothetical protein
VAERLSWSGIPFGAIGNSQTSVIVPPTGKVISRCPRMTHVQGYWVYDAHMVVNKPRSNPDQMYFATPIPLTDFHDSPISQTPCPAYVMLPRKNP